jgi:hypothetical protein
MPWGSSEELLLGFFFLAQSEVQWVLGCKKGLTFSYSHSSIHPTHVWTLDFPVEISNLNRWYVDAPSGLVVRWYMFQRDPRLFYNS